MTQTRRAFLATSGATITILPFMAHADGHSGDTFETPTGTLTVHPVRHASIIMTHGDTTIYVDPVGEPIIYSGKPSPDFIFVTHEHGDHFDPALLSAVAGPDTKLITNPAVYDKLPEDLKAQAVSLANGDSEALEIGTLTAIPAYNISEDRLQFHPQGRDNGYVLDLGGYRIYMSGDTEDIPEMRALENIDVAFVCMNLPFTMDATAAASAVSEFAPTYVYPYHYRGRGDGTQDPSEFAGMLTSVTEARLGGWYG